MDKKRRWKTMTLNIFFLTITIKKRVMDLEEIQKEEFIEKLRDELRDRRFSFHRPL
jgi:uncharacterized protein (TIGR02413 family)